MDPRTPPIILPAGLVEEGVGVVGGLVPAAATSSVCVPEYDTLEVGVPSSRLSKKNQRGVAYGESTHE